MFEQWSSHLNRKKTEGTNVYDWNYIHTNEKKNNKIKQFNGATMTRNWRLMHNAYGICVIKRIQINLPKCEVDSYMWQFKSYFSVYSSLHTVFVYIKWRCSVFIRVTREKWKAMQCTEKNIKITWDEDEKEEKEEEKPNTSNVIRAQQQHSERSRIWKKNPKDIPTSIYGWWCVPSAHICTCALSICNKQKVFDRKRMDTFDCVYKYIVII